MENKIPGKRSRNIELFRLEQGRLRTCSLQAYEYENNIGKRKPAILFQDEHRHKLAKIAIEIL